MSCCFMLCMSLLSVRTDCYIVEYSNFVSLNTCSWQFQGYNGSQLWDTAFSVQAIISTNLTEQYGSTLRKAHMFLKNSQVKFVAYCCCRFVIVTFNFLPTRKSTLFSVEGARWLPWWSSCLVPPHIKRCMAILNCWSRMAHFWLHCWRIQGGYLGVSNNIL